MLQTGGLVVGLWIALTLITYGIAHFTSSALIEYKSTHMNVSRFREAILNICLLTMTAAGTFLSLILAIIMVIFYD